MPHGIFSLGPIGDYIFRMTEQTAVEKLIFKAIETLETKSKLVYQLHDVEGLEMEAISKMTNLSLLEVKSAIDSSRKHIANWVQSKLNHAMEQK